jgi:hypothetical protein
MCDHRSLTVLQEGVIWDWKEAIERLIKLPNDEPETFQSYLHLLYTNDIAVIPDPLPANYDGREERLSLAKLYVLAEKLLDVDVKNATLKAMFHSTCQLGSDGIVYVSGLPVIRIIYAGTI